MLKLPKMPEKRARGGRTLWMVMCALLSLGLVSTVVDFAGQFSTQTQQALSTGQRVIIDARSGKVFRPDVPVTPPKAAQKAKTETTPKAEEAAPVASFDVGESEPPAATEEKPPEPKPAEAKPAETPAAPQAKTEAPVPIPASEMVDASAPVLAATEDTVTSIAPPTGNKGLVAAPAPEVAETTPQGVLPKRGGEGVTPARIYSHHFNAPKDAATLHVVVTGLGFSVDTLALARTLPPEVSFSFSPYAPHLSAALAASRGDGHEAWLDLPTQTEGYPQNDPGPLGLIASLSKEEFSARLNKLLMAAPGTVGVVLAADESLSLTPAAFTGLLETLHKRGLLVLSTHPTRRLQALGLKKEWQGDVMRSDLLLDEVPSEAAIKSKLAGIVTQTRERGRLVVVLRARPQSLMFFSDWLKKTNRQGVVLAPLSAALLKPLPPPKEPAKEKSAKKGAH